MRRWPGGPDEGENFMTLKDLARSLRQNETDAERKMWTVLRSRRFSGFKFRRQQPLGHYIVDFFCKDRGLIVELDGGQHLYDVKNDEERTIFIESHGFRVLRFWDHEVLKDPRSVLEILWKGPPHPGPLPRGEGKPQAPGSHTFPS
jgi:very-short-patch-repair endonuclease